MKTSACRDGTLKNQPNKRGMIPQYFPPSLHLVPTMPCVSGVHRRVVEGSYVVDSCNVVATEHGQDKTVREQCCVSV